MLLSLQDITKSFKSDVNAPSRIVLNGISLDVDKGETLSVLGPSGSGKSTLLNIIGTLDTPDSGKVILDRQDLTHMSESELTRIRSRKIGFIFQMHHLLPQCTVLENALLPVLPIKDGQFRKSRKKAVFELIKKVGLWPQRDQKPNILSGGECQRVAVVRALVNQPDLLLADEPTGSLDQDNATSIISLLLELNETFNTSLIVVTHSVDIGKRMKRQFELSNGKLFENSLSPS